MYFRAFPVIELCAFKPVEVKNEDMQVHIC